MDKLSLASFAHLPFNRPDVPFGEIYLSGRRRRPKGSGHDPSPIDHSADAAGP